MRLDELTRPENITLAAEVLKKAGYEKLDSGAFASVFMKPDANFVLKLFNAQDDAYKAYTALVRANPNPHFPKIGQRTVRVTDQYYAVKMEPLNGVTVSDRPVLEAIWWELAYSANIQDGAAAIAYMAKHPKLKEACTLIGRLQPKYMLDLGVRNFMKRGDTIVFIDPVWTGKLPSRERT